ncbi:MAG: ATP-binding protein, partial [Myxococcota bacterium]
MESHERNRDDPQTARDPAAGGERVESDEHARTLAEHAAALLLEIDDRGRTRYAGAGCVDILGYTSAELLEISLLELIHPGDRDRVVADFRRIEELGTVLTEHRGRHKDGSWRWFQDTVRAFRTPAGERRYAVIGRDVTAEKKLEATLERQAVVQHEIAELSRRFLSLEPGEIDAEVHRQLATPARLAGAGRTRLIMLDPDDWTVRCSYGWSAPDAPPEAPRSDADSVHQFQWSVRALARGEVINIASPDALPPEAAAEAADMRRRGVSSVLTIPVRAGESFMGYQIFEAFEPRAAWSPQELTELRLVGDIFASAIERMCAAEEMEQRRENEARVAEISRRFLGLAVDEIDSAVEDALAEAARIAGAQRACLHVFSNQLGLGRDSFEWCAPGVASVATIALEWTREKMRRGEPVHVPTPGALPPEAEAERRDLLNRGVRSALGIPVLSGSDAIGFLSFESHDRPRTWSERDATVLRMIGEILTTALRRRDSEAALRESRAQLLQAQKLEAVGRLAGGIAHDFNNLLTVILGFSRPLLAQLEAGGVREDVEEIQGAAERAAGLTKQLLTFSRRQTVATQYVELNPTVRRLESLLGRLLEEDVDLLFELHPESGWVEIDPHQLEQVVMNLAVNARDAMPDGGTLRLSTRPLRVGTAEATRLGLPGEGPYVVLSASDTGCGMDEETRAHLFDPFFTTKDPDKGTGLGLSIVYSVVEQAGGAITVAGGSAKGTTFEIYLPQVESSESSDCPASPAQESARAGHVLVVDDEESVRRVARRLLERAGHRVSEACNGQEAIRLCTESDDPPDLVLTDWVMPRMGGEELALRLRGLRPEIRLVFMSGYPLQPARA